MYLCRCYAMTHVEARRLAMVDLSARPAVRLRLDGTRRGQSEKLKPVRLFSSTLLCTMHAPATPPTIARRRRLKAMVGIYLNLAL